MGSIPVGDSDISLSHARVMLILIHLSQRSNCYRSISSSQILTLFLFGAFLKFHHVNLRKWTCNVVGFATFLKCFMLNAWRMPGGRGMGWWGFTESSTSTPTFISWWNFVRHHIIRYSKRKRHTWFCNRPVSAMIIIRNISDAQGNFVYLVTHAHGSLQMLLIGFLWIMNLLPFTTKNNHKNSTINEMWFMRHKKLKVILKGNRTDFTIFRVQ